MKRTVFIILFIFSGLYIFGQADVRNFRFGMSIDEAKVINPNLTVPSIDRFHRGNWPVYIMQYLFNSELASTIPNPLVDFTGEYPVNRSNYVVYNCCRYDNSERSNNYFRYGDSQYKLLFYDNKLVGIETYFNYTGLIISELNQLYGNGFTVSLSSGDDARVWNNQTRGRYVVWYLSDRTLQVVTYIDSQWIRVLCRTTLEEYRRSTDNPRNRLDW